MTVDVKQPRYIVTTLNPFEGRYNTETLQKDIGGYNVTEEGRLMINDIDGVLIKLYNAEHWFSIEFVPGEDSQEDSYESETTSDQEAS